MLVITGFYKFTLEIFIGHITLFMLKQSGRSIKMCPLAKKINK